MSTAAWPTKAAPWAVVAGVVLLAAGLLCIVYAVLMLAHGDRPWGLPAYAALTCVAVLIGLRLRRDLRTQSITLLWDATHGTLRNKELARPYELKKVWRAWGWVTLAVVCPEAPRQVRYLVVWKSSISPPLWSELALRLEAGTGRLGRQ